MAVRDRGQGHVQTLCVPCPKPFLEECMPPLRPRLCPLRAATAAWQPFPGPNPGAASQGRVVDVWAHAPFVTGPQSQGAAKPGGGRAWFGLRVRLSVFLSLFPTFKNLKYSYQKFTGKVMKCLAGAAGPPSKPRGGELSRPQPLATPESSLNC